MADLDNAADWHFQLRQAALMLGEKAQSRLQEIVNARTQLVKAELDALGAGFAADGTVGRDVEGGVGDGPDGGS